MPMECPRRSWADASPMRGVRDKIVLATKVYGTLTKDFVIATADESLTRLNTDRIDLLYLHNWDGETPSEETMSALNTLVESGKVRAIGCSNWQAWQLAKSLLHCRHPHCAPCNVCSRRIISSSAKSRPTCYRCASTRELM